MGQHEANCSRRESFMRLHASLRVNEVIMERNDFELVIIGGGTAGVDMAARMRRHIDPARIAVIEPSDKHYYQPLWTLVGGGVATKEQSMRREADVLPNDVAWIRERAAELRPQENVVVTASGRRISYKQLIVAPGLKIDWDAVPGLRDALAHDPRVSSNYDYDLSAKTFEALKAFKGGRALFTWPSTPVKCGGAPQKIMYLAEDFWRRQGVRSAATVEGWFAPAKIFSVPEYRKTFESIVERKQIDLHMRRNLVEIRREASEAVFQDVDHPDVLETVRYDFMHVTPPMAPPDFVAASPLAIADGAGKGWMEVDPYTLQSPRFPNAFGIGDVASLPTSKTGAAVRKQAIVLEKNLVALRAGADLAGAYNGYTSCPVVTGYGKLVLAEFGYDDKLMPTFPIDSTKERWSMYMLKKYGLPWLYWNLMLKGRA